MWEIKPQCHENTNKEWVTLQHCCQTLELPTTYQTQPLKPSRSSRASVCNLSVSSPSGCWRPAPRRVAVSIVAVNAEENNWHALAECKHSEVVSERRRCVAAVHKLPGGSNGRVVLCEEDHGSVVGAGRRGLCQGPAAGTGSWD